MRKNIIKLARADYAQYKWAIFLSFLAAILIANCLLTVNCHNINNIRLYLDGTTNFSIEQMKEMKFNNAISQITVIFLIVILFMFSCSFVNYFDKRKAPQTVMLPATKREKFFYIVLRNILLIPISLILINYINAAIWSSIINVDYTFMNYNLSVWCINGLLVQGIILTIFFSSSIYFRSRHFVYSFIIVVTGFIMHTVVFKTLGSYYNNYILNIVMSLFIVGLLYSVWWKYKNIQIK